MTNEAKRLDACPFCEGACAVTKGYSTSELPWSDNGGNFFRVYCSKCQARQLFHRTEAEAIEAWNRRAAQVVSVTVERDEAVNRAYQQGLSVTRGDIAQLKQEHAAELTALAQPAVSEDARDAARYRWLRAQHWSDKTLTVTNPKSVGLGRMIYGREGLDAAIDAAMASQEKPHD